MIWRVLVIKNTTQNGQRETRKGDASAWKKFPEKKHDVMR